MPSEENKTLHWGWHVFIAIGTFPMLPPFGTILYIGGVLTYYGAKWLLPKVGITSSEAKTFVYLFSVGLSIAFGFLCLIGGAIAFANTEWREFREVFPFVCVLLAVMSFPFSFLAIVATSKVIQGIIDAPRKRAQQLRDEELAREQEIKRREAEAQARQRQIEHEQEYQRQKTRHARLEEAKAQCELFYVRHKPEIEDRFPRSAFDDFVAAYMTDNHDADTVERRGRELCDIMESHRTRVEPAPPKPKSIADLAEWYLSQKNKIDELPLDPKTKQVQLIRLKERYSELSASLLEEMEP